MKLFGRGKETQELVLKVRTAITEGKDAEFAKLRAQIKSPRTRRMLALEKGRDAANRGDIEGAWFFGYYNGNMPIEEFLKAGIKHGKLHKIETPKPTP